MHRKLTFIVLGIGAGICAKGALAEDAPRSLLPRAASALPAWAPNAISAEPAHAILLDQARLWQSRGRDDLARDTLDKLLRSAPDHPEALAQLAYLALRNNQKEKAKQILERLRARHPNHPNIARLDTMFRLEGQDKERLRRARILAKGGKPGDALAAFKELYPDGPPSSDLALEYWQIVGNTENGWERALAGMTRLVAEYPDHPRYRLALAEHIAARRPDDSAALKTIAELAKQRDGKAARKAWRSTVLRLRPVPSSVPLIEQYLANEKTDDTAVKEHLASIKAAVERNRLLQADPYYRARLDGLAMLDGGRIEAAEEKLLQSLEGRPTDPEVLGGFGLLRMRQGHHAEAQAYFQEARRYDANNNRWINLLGTARYWGLMREASDALDNGEFSIAETKLNEARAIDPREPAVLVSLGRAFAAQGRNMEAEKVLKEALSREPANSGALQALVTLYLRMGREEAANTLLANLAGEQKKNFAVAVDAARASLFKQKAEIFLVQGKTDEAIAMLERATQHDREDPWLRFDLARLYGARGEAEKGNALFSALLTAHPDNAAAHYAYALFLSNQDKALSALSTLERIAEQNRTANMTALQRRLWMRVVIQSSVELAKSGRAAAARRLLDDACEAMGEDSERLLDLADARIDIGDSGGARTLLARLTMANPPSIDWRLRHARLTISAGAETAASPLLVGIARMQLSAEQAAALNDIQATLALRKAEDLRQKGRVADALDTIASLRREHPGNERLLVAEARFARALGNRGLAETNYRTLLQSRPENRDAAMALIEVLLESKRNAEARRLLDEQLSAREGASADQMADFVGALIDLDDREQAWKMVGTTLAMAPDHPRALAYASRLARQDGKLDEAIDYLRLSLANDMSERSVTNTITLSSLQQTPMPDGSVPPALEVIPAPLDAVSAEATATSAYRTMAEMLDQKTSWLAGAYDKRARSGSPGTSKYDATEIPLESKLAQGPIGRWAIRADLVKLNAGNLDLSDSNAAETFGSTLLCQPVCNSGTFAQRASGVALNAALEREGTRFDIGTTPLGFPVQSLIGGILHKGDMGPFGYAIDVSRRPLTGSVLSYAGTRDPRTGQVWGGVQVTGARLGLSLDDGGQFGGWSSLGLHRLTGKNVLDNTRMQLMAGAIVRVINENDRLLQFGLTGMVWRLAENAGEYTFGHGGYYSPETYKSLALPVTFGQRHERLSYAVRASISTSRSNTKSAAYFPTDPAMQATAERLADITNVTPFYSGGPGQGVGRSLAMSWEYQVDPRSFVGGLLELERSPDYAPNRFVLYVRYALDRAAARPVSFLPQPVSPTSQF